MGIHHLDYRIAVTNWSQKRNVPRSWVAPFSTCTTYGLLCAVMFVPPNVVVPVDMKVTGRFEQ